MIGPHTTPGPVSPSGASTSLVAPTPAELASYFPQPGKSSNCSARAAWAAVYPGPPAASWTASSRLKVLLAEWGRDPPFAERFPRGARALARLNHAHIVAVA